MTGLEGILGPLVSGAGQLAGGYVADQILGDDQYYPKGGNMPGLTSADAAKSGVIPAVQIDLENNKAFEYFEEATKKYEEFAMKGLDKYREQMQAAIASVAGGSEMANQKLQGLVNRGNSALDLYMKSVGLDAPSPTLGYDQTLLNMGNQYSDISSLMRQAEKIQDPTQRQTAKLNILQQLDTSAQQQAAAAKAKYDQQMAALGAEPNPYDYAVGSVYGGYGYWSAPFVPLNIDEDMGNRTGPRTLRELAAPFIKHPYKGSGTNEQGSGYPGIDLSNRLRYQAINDYAQASDAWIFERNRIESEYAATQPGIQQLVDFRNKYNAYYDKDADYFALSNEELKAMGLPQRPGDAPEAPAPITAESLKDFPGYQFALQQGLDAAQRSAAAKGMLNSGNTLAALTEYAEGLATQTYGIAEQARVNQYGMQMQSYGAQSTTFNNYLTSLMNVAGIGVNATHAQATNIFNAGTAIGSLFNNSANAHLGAYQQIGEANYQSQMHSGDVYNTDLLANMAAQNEMLKSGSGEAASMAGAALGAAPGLANVGFQQQQYNDTRFQQQQYANSFNSNYQWLAPDRGNYGLR